MILYICTTCGKIIQDIDEIRSDILKRKYLCSCGSIISMENSYPPLNCQDFVLSAYDLLEQAKCADKQNVNDLLKFLNDEHIVTDITTVDSYLNTYESIRQRYQDNKREFFLEIDDEFEKILMQKLGPTEVDTILSYIRICNKNKFRKPILIMLASIFEHLFNDYFELLVQSRFTENGASYFLKKYDTAGIQACLDIANSFTDESIRCKMEKCLPGFYDNWAEFRKLRNNIVHSNTIYISKLKLLNVFNLLDESIRVFSTLVSQVYYSKGKITNN